MHRSFSAIPTGCHVHEDFLHPVTRQGAVRHLPAGTLGLCGDGRQLILEILTLLSRAQQGQDGPSAAGEDGTMMPETGPAALYARPVDTPAPGLIGPQDRDLRPSIRTSPGEMLKVTRVPTARWAWPGAARKRVHIRAMVPG